jgi:hypothetical protein
MTWALDWHRAAIHAFMWLPKATATRLDAELRSMTALRATLRGMGDPARQPAPDASLQAHEDDDLDGEVAREIDRRAQDAEATGNYGRTWEDVFADLKAKHGWR